ARMSTGILINPPKSVLTVVSSTVVPESGVMATAPVLLQVTTGVGQSLGPGVATAVACPASPQEMVKSVTSTREKPGGRRGRENVGEDTGPTDPVESWTTASTWNRPPPHTLGGCSVNDPGAGTPAMESAIPPSLSRTSETSAVPPRSCGQLRLALKRK